jgi:cytochrome c-type biogenesis protein CcmH
MTPPAANVLFWALAAAMTAAALAFVLRPLLARRARAKRNGQAVARTPDAQRLRTVRAFATRRTGIVVAIALPLLAAGLYVLLGEPGALDTATGTDAVTAFDAMPVSAKRDDLVAHLARNPRDARGWVLFARLELAEDRYAESADAFARAIAANPKVGRDPDIWCEYADALGMAQGGTLAGQPLAFVQHALAQDPAHPRALEMAGSAAFETRDFAGAARYWRTLAAQLPPASPAQRELESAIARADLLAGSGAR